MRKRIRAKMYRVIPVPAPIAVVIGKDADGKPVTRSIEFAAFVVESLLEDRRWGLDRTNLKRAAEVERAVIGESMSVRVSDLAWELLRDVASKPQFGPQGVGYAAGFGRQLLPFIDAICNAEAEAPQKEASKG